MSEYLVLDTETGGLNPKDSSLLTMYAAIYDKDFNIVDELSLKTKPDNGCFNVEASALKVNKIDLIKHAEQALTYSEAKEKLLELIKNNKSRKKLKVVGHNPSFDLTFIHEHLIDKATWEKYTSYRLTDTAAIGNFLKMCGKIPQELPENLSSYAMYFGIDNIGAHDAEFDVKLTVKVLRSFMGLITGEPVPIEDKAQECGAV